MNSKVCQSIHNVKHNVNSKNQLMHNNYYFSKQHIDNSCMVIILISAGNKECKLQKRQAITPYQIWDGNYASKQLVCIAGYQGKHEK